MFVFFFLFFSIYSKLHLIICMNTSHNNNESCHLLIIVNLYNKY